MASGTLNKIDINVSQAGDNFSAVDIQRIDDILTEYITKNSDKFNQLIANNKNNPNVNLDYILDHAWSFLDDLAVSSGEQEPREGLLIDGKLAWLERAIELKANKVQFMNELKALNILVNQRNLWWVAPATDVVHTTTNSVSDLGPASKDSIPEKPCVSCDDDFNERGEKHEAEIITPPVPIPSEPWERLEDRDGPLKEEPRYGPLKWYIPGQWYYVRNKGEDWWEDTKYDIADGKDKKAMKNLFLWWVSWFLNRPEKEVDMVVEGEKIWPKLKGELKQFWKAVRKMWVDDFGRYFTAVRDAYGYPNNIASKTFWDDKDLSDKLGNRREAKTLALIGAIYTNYRDLKEKPYSGTYMERLIGTIENDIADGGQSFDASKSYNKHNDNVEVKMEGSHILINKNNRLNESLNIDERKWIKELFDLNGVAHTIQDFDHVMRLIRLQEHDKANMANIINAVHQWNNLIGIDGKPLNAEEKDLYDTRQQIESQGASTQRMVMEWLSFGMRPEYIANVKMLMDKAKLDEKQYGHVIDAAGNIVHDNGTEEDKEKRIITPEVHFVWCIEDIIVNGKTDFGDKGIISGLQFRSLFQTAVNEIKFDNGFTHQEAQRRVVYNIVCFVKQKANQLWYFDFATHLDAILGKAVDDKLDASLLVGPESFLSRHPWYLKWFQDIMMNSSVPVDAIMKYGDSGFIENQKQTKDSFAAYAEQLLVSKEELEEINIFTNTQWKNLMSESTERGMSDMIQWEREAIMQQLNASVLDYVIQNRTAGWIGVGVSASLDTILKWLSAHLSLGIVWDKWNISPMLWFSLWHHVNLGRWRSLDTRWWASLTTAWIPILGKSPVDDGTLPWFTPFLGQSITKQRELNKDKFKKTLDAKPLVTAHVGVNYGVVMLGPIISPIVGIHTGVDINRQAGIEKEFKEIRHTMKWVTNTLFNMPWLIPDLNTISDYGALLAKKKVAIDTIEKVLKYGYTSNGKHIDGVFSHSKHDIRQAAENLYKWMLYFGCVNTTMDKLTAADMLAEFYAVQRKNIAIEKTRWWFSWFDIGIDYVILISTPVISAAISFEKYYTSTYADSRESLLDIENAKNLGRGNRLKSKTIGQSEVDLLNDQLTSYARKTAGVEPTISLEKRDGVDLIKIPDALYAHNRSEICIDPSLKWCIMHDEKNHCFYIPKSTIVRLGSFAAGQNTGYTLNLGDNKTEKDDLRLQAWRERLLADRCAPSDEIFLANAKEYAKKSGEVRVITASNITQSFDNLRQGDYATFPKLEAQGAIANGHINVKVEDNFVYKPSPTNGIISLSTTGTLTVHERMVNGQREIHFLSTPGTSALTIRYETYRTDINNTLLTVNTINQNTDMRLLYANTLFPLSTAQDVTGDVLSFALKNNVTVNANQPVLVNGGLLSVPLGQKLIIDYDPVNKTYAAKSIPMIGNAQSIAVNFSDGSSTQAQHCEIDGILDHYKQSYIDITRNNTFSPTNVLWLSELEDLSDNRNLYYQFMEVLNSSVKVSIEDTDIDTAIRLLTQILTNGLKNTKSVSASQQLLDTIKALAVWGDYDRKTYIINKMKQIFSLEEKQYIGQKIGSLFTARWGVFDALVAKEKSLGGKFNTAWYKKNFTDTVNSTFNKWSYASQANIIGFTSYYRHGSAGIQNKWFSLSWLGDVNVYESGGKPALKILTDVTEKALAKTWFINKLEKNRHEFAVAKQSYYDKIKQVDWLWSFTLDDATFKKLLMWESVVINGREISVKANMIAYLQGECCNQWIGMQIESVCYDDVDAIITEDGRIKEVSEDVVGNTQGGRFYMSTPSTRLISSRERKEKVIGVALGTQWKPEELPPPPPPAPTTIPHANVAPPLPPVPPRTIPSIL